MHECVCEYAMSVQTLPYIPYMHQKTSSIRCEKRSREIDNQSSDQHMGRRTLTRPATG